MRSVLVWLMVLFGGVFAPTAPARGDIPDCHPAELFATDNTDPLFEMQADVTMAQNGASVTGSIPLDGVYSRTRCSRASMSVRANFICAAPTVRCTPPPRRCAASSTRKRC